MAITKVTEFALSTSATGNPQTFSGVTAASGNFIVLMVATSGGRTLSSVTDAAGNTWTVHLTGASSTTTGLGVASCKVTSALSAQNLTINLSGTGFVAAKAVVYSGMHATTWFRTVPTLAATWT